MMTQRCIPIWLLLIGTLAVGIPQAEAAIPKASPTECITYADEELDTTSYPYTLRNFIKFFNKDGVDEQRCQEKIVLQDDIKLSMGSIKLSGDTNAKGLTIDGLNHVILGGNAGECVIDINTSNVTIKNLLIKDVPQHAICIREHGAKKVNTIKFENVVIYNAKGTGVAVDAKANTVHVNKGVRVIHTDGPGVDFQGTMLAQTHKVFFKVSFDDKGVSVIDDASASFWDNGENSNLGIRTLSKLKFKNVLKVNNTVQGDIEACVKGVCELTTPSAVLLYRVGERTIETKEQCLELVDPVIKEFCEPGKEAELIPDPNVADAQILQKALDDCAGFESDFMVCMGQAARLKTNLVGAATKGNNLSAAGHFTIIVKSEKFLTQNDQDAFILVPVDAEGDAGHVLGASSCAFIPKKEITPETLVIESGNCTDTTLGNGGGDDDDGDDDGEFDGGDSGDDSDFASQQGEILVEGPVDGKQVHYYLDRKSVIKNGVKNKTECLAVYKFFLGQMSQLASTDSDQDGIPDIMEDRNLTCYKDSNETDLFNPDTDGDGILDRNELGTTGFYGYRECYLITSDGADSVIASDVDIGDEGTITAPPVDKDKNGKVAHDYDTAYLALAQPVTNPKDGKEYTAVPYIVSIDDQTGAPCHFPTPFTKDNTSCVQDALIGGLTPKGFKEGTTPGTGFCRGTTADAFPGDTDQDGYSDGRELRPLAYNAKDPYYYWDWIEGQYLRAVDPDTKELVDRIECDSSGDTEEEIGRYFKKDTITIEASPFADYDSDGIANHDDDCPTVPKRESEQGEADCANAPKWDGTVTHTGFFLCMSDSVSAPGSVDGGFYSSPASFNTGIGQTNPFNIDTDSDGFCDGPVGPACVNASASDIASTTQDERNLDQQDLVPWFKHPDGSNAKDLPCKEGYIYKLINPKYKKAVQKAVEELFTAYTPSGNTLGMGYDVIAQTVLLHYEGQVQNIINANGGVTPPDLDEDGIWDVIESPDGKCTEKATHGFTTSAFDPDSDDDGLGDMFDPCPNDDNAGTPFSDPLTAPSAYEAEIANHAKICNATGPNRYLANKALYCFLDWDQDGLRNCFEDFNISGVDPQTFINETNVKVADSDSDQLNDYLERYVHTTNPIQIDTDQDGLDDHNEVSRDGDVFVKQDTVLGKSAGTCVDAGQKDTDPKSKDTDGDGLDDGFELNITSTVEGKLVTNPNNWDSDGDGLYDGGELPEGSIAKDKCKNCKAGEDLNGDGIHPVSIKDDAGNVAVLLAGGIDESDPCTADTDGDTKTDETDECKTISHQSCTAQNKMGFDSDLDGIANLSEGLTGTDPTNDDTDGDGLIDGCLKNEDAEPVMGGGELCNQIKQGQFFALFNKLNKPNCGGVPYFGCDTDPGKMNNPEYNANVARDTDKDGMTDLQDRLYFTNPLKLDTDGDGLADGLEDTKFIENDDGTVTEVIGSIDGFFTPCTEQTDQGGKTGLVCPETNANDSDTDKDGLPDGKIGILCEDCNLNGFQDKIVEGLQIKFLETSGKTWDSDGDGNSDYMEATVNGGFQKANISAATAGAFDSCSLVMSTQAPAPGLYLWYLLLAGLPIVLWERRRTRVRRGCDPAHCKGSV